MRQLYINGSVATVDSEMSYVQAFAVEDGKFIKTGTNEEILALKTEDSAVVDLEGKTVMPGFNDAHLHILNWASYHGEDRAKIDLEGITSIEELIEKVQEYIKEKNIPEGKWVVGRGWNENNYAEKRCINYADLDRISTVHPIVLTRIDEHVVAVNSMGLERIGITDDTPNPAGGHIQRDENGKATGLLQENARYMAYSLLPDADVQQIKKLLINVMDHISKLGITSVSTDDFETFSSKNWKYILQAYKELEEEGKLKVRITEQCLLITKPQLLEFLEAGYKTGVGSDMFKIGPLKVVSDGTIGSATALLQAPYADHPETCGMAEFEEEVMDDLIITAHKGGMQILCHTIGDGAAKMCMRAFDQMLAIKPVEDPRCGLVHVQIADQEIFDKMRDDKIIAFIQPINAGTDMQCAESRVGPERMKYSYRYRTMYDHGIITPFTSDWPVDSVNVFDSIYVATTRKNLQGQPEGGWYPEECFDPEQALRGFTIIPAYTSYDENKKGSIEAGKFADFVILSDDFTKIDPEHVRDIQVLGVYLGGKKVN